MRGDSIRHFRPCEAEARQRMPGMLRAGIVRPLVLGAVALILNACQQPPTVVQSMQEPMMPPRERMNVQRATAYMIESLGGETVYGFEDFDGSIVPAVRPERELVDRLFEVSNPEEWPRIIYVELEGEHITDNELVLLHYLPDLVGLSINDSRMAQHLPDLVEFSVRDGGITDGGLAPLAGLTQLRELRLTATRVNGPGLAHVSWLPRLEVLNLVAPSLENDSLSHLRLADNLQRLSLAAERITDEAVPYLAQIPKLTSLSIHDTSITGAGLRHLRSCQHLTRLSLGDRQLTEEGIDQLKLMPNLERISAMEGALSPELEAKLRRARPVLEISFRDL